MEEQYSKEQEEYMDNIHLPDSLSNSKWEKTLYKPLRNSINDLITQNESENILYIGCGPDAPLFNCNLSENPILKNLNNITFSDISPKYLKNCKAKMNGLTKKIKYQQEDITNGLAEYYFQLMKSVFKERNSAIDLQIRLDYINTNIDALLDKYSLDLDRKNGELYHFIYSEMVATYTGIPTITFCEKELAYLKAEGLITDEQFILFSKLVVNIWKQYNDKILKNHITSLALKLKPNGIIAIATDIEKVFDDPEKESILSINTKLSDLSFNNLQTISSVKTDQYIEWDDSIRNDNINVNSPSLEPHFHNVVVLAYQKI